MRQIGVFEIPSIRRKDMSIDLEEGEVRKSNYVMILHRDKLGNRIFQHTYTIGKDEIMSCPFVMNKNGKRIRRVPISRLHVIS